MNAPFQFLCGNAVSPEYLRSLDTPHFTEQHIARFDEETQATVREQQAYLDAHPAIAIFRFATEGSHTRNGGVIQQGDRTAGVQAGKWTVGAWSAQRRLRHVCRWQYGADHHRRRAGSQ